MSARAYSIRSAVDGFQRETTVFAQSAGKAKYAFLLNAWDAFGERVISFRHLKVRSLGVISTPLEIAESKAASFNRNFPPGTPIRVWSGTLEGDHKDVVVAPPGAYLIGDEVVIKIPGDCIILSHVHPLVRPRA